MRVSFGSSFPSYTLHARFASATKKEISPHQLKFGSCNLRDKKPYISLVVWLILVSLITGELAPFAESRGRKNASAKAKTEHTTRGEKTEERGVTEEPEHPHTHHEGGPKFSYPSERSCSKRKFVAGIGCPYKRLAPHRFKELQPRRLSRTKLVT